MTFLRSLFTLVNMVIDLIDEAHYYSTMQGTVPSSNVLSGAAPAVLAWHENMFEILALH